MGAVYPFIVSLIAGLVSTGTIVALLRRAAIALGVSALTYTGVSVAFSSMEGYINAQFAGMSANVVTMLIILHIPNALDVVFSAYIGAITLKGLTAAGAITKYGTSTAAGTVFSPGTF
jgi:hypothetical protein